MRKWGYFGAFFTCYFSEKWHFQAIPQHIFVYTNVFDFMNICTYVNVCKMWETPEKCGKLAKKCGKRVEKCLKNVDNCPKNVGNFVDKMWECG